MTAAGQISCDYFGTYSDRILPGDYDGDGRDDLALTVADPANPTQRYFRVRPTSIRPGRSLMNGARPAICR